MAMLDPRTVPAPNPDTARVPEKLYQHLRRVSEALLQVYGAYSEIAVDTPVELDMEEVRQALSVNGEFPLNVEGLLGVLSDPQIAGAVIASTLPAVSLYPPGTLLILTGTTTQLYYLSDSNPSTWTSIALTATEAVDNTFFIRDDGDATKKIRFEASTIATATTRVMTAPNVDQILAGRNVDNSFSVSQTVTGAPDAFLSVAVNNTNSSGTSALSGVAAQNGVSSIILMAAGTARTASSFGVVTGGYGMLISALSGFLLGTSNATDLVIGTNNVERVRVDSNGLAKFIRPGQAILIKPSSAPAANTLMLELQSNAGVSKFSVDIEGDVLANNITSAATVTGVDVLATGTGASVVVDNSGSSAVDILRALQGGVEVFAVTGAGDTDVWGTFTAHSSSTLSGTLDVSGAATFASTVKVQSAARLFSGTGSPNGSVTGTSGDYFFRTDTPATLTQRIYVCTGGTSWTGIL